MHRAATNQKVEREKNEINRQSGRGKKGAGIVKN
jgi:hypothetical protein